MKWRELSIIVLVVIFLFLLTSFTVLSPSWLKDLRHRLPVHPTRRYSRRQLAQIEEVIIHHTLGPVDQTPAEIADYHASPGNHICADGCPGIAYHILIDQFGQAYQVNDLEAISYHVSGENTRTVGICLIGNYDNLLPSKEQYKTTGKVIKWINRRVGKNLAIGGHRDYSSKSCPGANVDVEFIRKTVYGA